MTATMVDLGNALTCYSCGTPFCMGKQYEKDRRSDHRSFYCPNGHSQAFLSESDEEKLKRQLKWERDNAARLRAEADQLKGSLTATKGHVTRLRNRAASGDCPYGCGRRFAGLAEHIAKKHPDEPLVGE